MVTDTWLYNKSIKLTFDDKKHIYSIEGKVIDGVTTILKIIDKPALMYWAVNQACDYIDKNLPLGVKIDEIQKKALLDGAKAAHRKKSTDAADHGAILHDWIEKHIKGFKPELPVNPILQESAKQFLKWEKENNVVFKASEKKVLSLKYSYVGTLDFTATINGKRVVGDLKTSNGIWDEYWLQLAAYKQALQEEFPDANVDHTVIVRCGKDGAFEVQERDDFDKNIEAFLAALTLHRRIKEMKFNTPKTCKQ